MLFFRGTLCSYQYQENKNMAIYTNLSFNQKKLFDSKKNWLTFRYIAIWRLAEQVYTLLE